MLSKSALIMGGNGALGKTMGTAFKAQSWKVINVDLHKNDEADHNLIINGDDKIQNQLNHIYE